ncbi:hypothetical protein [Cohnella soli]|uniref:Intracellular proteinase inhibitor BsuPI domain-containing protein n=1 Tax=Cohnella soli TaxID=425005 RepID=A0ABW0HV96_9BACL
MNKILIISLFFVFLSACIKKFPEEDSLIAEISSDKKIYHVDDLVRINIFLKKNTDSDLTIKYENLSTLYYVDQNGKVTPIRLVGINGEPVVNAGIGVESTWSGKSAFYEIDSSGDPIKNKLTKFKIPGEYKIYSIETFSLIQNKREKKYSIKSNEITVLIK